MEYPNKRKIGGIGKPWPRHDHDDVRPDFKWYSNYTTNGEGKRLLQLKIDEYGEENVIVKDTAFNREGKVIPHYVALYIKRAE